MGEEYNERLQHLQTLETMNRSDGSVCIEHLSVENWRSRVSRSNRNAMQKRHKYPRYEGAFLTECCTFQESDCPWSCFCKKVGCGGVWVLRPDLEFQTFLRHFAQLWDRGSDALRQKVNDSRLLATGRSKNAVPILQELQKQWSNWDGSGNSLPSVVHKIRCCYFCNDSFTQIMPHVKTIVNLASDSSGVYTSKLISQVFYDIAVPFDNGSAAIQKMSGYDPNSYGDGKLREQARNWLMATGKSIDAFRMLDDAFAWCWCESDRERHKSVGTACSRVLDKLFY